MDTTRITGKVKWFNLNKGFGFIQTEDNTNDIFVHVSALERAGLKSLNDGQPVSFELENHKGRISAINLQLLK